MIFVARTKNGIYVLVSAQNEYSAVDILKWALLPKDSIEKIWKVSKEHLQERTENHDGGEHDAHAGALGLKFSVYLGRRRSSHAVVRNYMPGTHPPRRPESPPQSFVVGMGPFDLKHRKGVFVASHPDYGEIQIEGMLRDRVRSIFVSVIDTLLRHYKA